jgi:hypothetical protein
MKRKLILCSAILLSCSWNGFSQSSEGYIDKAVPAFDNESKEIDRSKLEINPIRLYVPDNNFNRNSSLLSVTDRTDVQVFPSAIPQSEQHMTVSKVHPNNILLCSNTSNYEGYYVSQDGGATWFGSDNMPDNQQTYGDPTTAFDISGNAFMEAMTVGPTGYKTFKSTNQGTSWGAPNSQNFGNSNFDKQMMAIDNQAGSPYVGNIYTAWTDFSGSYSVQFNRSINGGTSYTTPIVLHAGWGQGTSVQTGPSGEVYVCWANYGAGTYPSDGIGFSRSLDGGASFTQITPAFTTVGIRPNNSPNPLFNNTRVNDFPSMAVDKSCGPHRGRIYIAVGAKQGGTGKAVAIIRYSDNNGTTWSALTEVSISAGLQNWFPCVTVDDATGTVSVSYLSLDQATGFTTNTYLAYSFNGGVSWDNIKVSDVGHTVAAIPGFASGYCGDYIGNTAWGNKNYIAWNDNRTGTWQNYVSRVDFSQPVVFSSGADIGINGPVTHALPTATNILYEAVHNITSPVGSTFVIQSGASVNMLAGGHIILSPGFRANSGSHFKGSVGTVVACTNTLHRDIISNEISDLQRDLKPAYKGDPTVQFSFYPNPASDEINFEYLLTDLSDVKIVLTDMQGKEVKVLMDAASQQPGLNTFSYDVSSLRSGIYIYRLVTNGYTKTGKFTKVD